MTFALFSFFLVSETGMIDFHKLISIDPPKQLMNCLLMILSMEKLV